MKNKTLVFSIAMNGYQLLYKEHLKTHYEYAAQHNYKYILVKRPSFTNIGADCCWLKLTLMRSALEAGYSKILFVDSDAKIHKDTPALDLFDHDKDGLIYMAKGYTGRYNSGVIIVKNSRETINWIKKVIENYEKKLPEKDSVGWGENGHIIHFSKNIPFIKTLSTKWNNTFDPNLNDYIRHYSHGPLRNKPFLFLFHLSISRASKFIHKTICLFKNKNESKLYKINSLSNKICKVYPVFCNPNFSK